MSDGAAPSPHPTIKPLQGIRVIDVSHQAAGPWCTTLLGDMGAEVWKIEKPDRGDFTDFLHIGGVGKEFHGRVLGC